VISLPDPSNGGLNKDGIAGAIRPGGGTVAVDVLPDGKVIGGAADGFGKASGLAAMLAVDSGAALSAAVSTFSESAVGACAVCVLEFPKSRKLPAIWIDPTTMAMMLADLHPPAFPVATGVIYCDPAPSYEQLVHEQAAAAGKPKDDIGELIHSGRTWQVE